MVEKRKNIKRELIEWAVIIIIPLTLYLTGTHTEVIGQIQRVVLMPGFLTPDIEIPVEDQLTASYDLKLTDKEGQQIGFEKFQGKTVFMNFWATWCAPCIAEMPDIESLYRELGDNVEFVMISIDNDPQKARDFIDKKGFTLPVYRQASRMPAVYERTVIPTTYVISPEGKIVAERHGMAKYNTSEFKEFLLSF
ncbi:MAG: TlpA disulfide reductase family protein [Cyclobacteriaceae bacterium]